MSKTAATIGGTSAKLRTGDVLSVWDLLHGLMLPSGNDAAITLAEHFGQYLFEVATRYKQNKTGAGVPAGGATNSAPGATSNALNGGAAGVNQTGPGADASEVQRRMQSD